MISKNSSRSRYRMMFSGECWSHGTGGHDVRRVRASGRAPPAGALLTVILTRPKSELLLSELNHGPHRPLGASESVHGRPEAREQVHDCLEQTAGPWHDNDLGPALFDCGQHCAGDMDRR